MQRRDFLAQGCAAGVGLSGWRWRGTGSTIRFGYAAITWSGNDRQAIADISALGFRGIQLRQSAVDTWQSRPEELKELLAQHHLILTALSSGTVVLDPAAEADNLALHQRNARFLHEVGGLYLQVVDQRPRGRDPVAEDFVRSGRLLTEIGRRAVDAGAKLGYHNHMGNLGQGPDEVARVLDASDPRFVHLELDTAHYQQGGGDPAQAVRRHAGRLLFLHLKDLETPAPGRGPGSYRFVELGRGKVDFKSVFGALDQTNFDGWGVVELDAVTDSARTPKESGAISRSYLESLGITI